MIERCRAVGEEAVADKHHVAVDGEEDDLGAGKLIVHLRGGVYRLCNENSDAQRNVANAGHEEYSSVDLQTT